MPEATNTVQIARPSAEVFEFLSDGTNDLMTIAERSQLPYAQVREAAEALRRHDLLEPCA